MFNFKEFIYSEIKRQGITITQLADRMDMDKSNIYTAISVNNPVLSTLLRYTEALNVDLTTIDKQKF